MSLSAAQLRGHKSRLQGHYGENYVRVLAAAAGLYISKDDPEPPGVDLNLTLRDLEGVLPTKKAELSIKTVAAPAADGQHFHFDIKSSDYRELAGALSVDFDLPRYLVVVVVPNIRVHYSDLTHRGQSLNHGAYFLDLMGSPALLEGQATKRLSVPTANLLTPTRLVELVCGDSGRATEWMSI
ncbi:MULTISPECIES: DUF4365 domain-containing protein [unclassified Pseudarthrobacter]|uniref:DUF4365 domain-containing protein n=1 Tax=unclassified Pseudarthrobacter TaxID=2647000 RepID=UPI003FA79667